MPSKMISLFRITIRYYLAIGRSFRPWRPLFPRSSSQALPDLFLTCRPRGTGATYFTLLCGFVQSSKHCMEVFYIGVLFPISQMLFVSSLLRRRDFDSYLLPNPLRLR